MRSWRLTFCALASALVGLACTSPGAALASRPVFGLNDTATTFESQISATRRLGARLARLPASWALIEPRPGEYDWSALDSAFATLRSNHVRVLFSLGAAPPWAAPDCSTSFGAWTVTCGVGDGHEGDYVEFATHLLARYPGSKVQAWNEPDLPLFGGLTPQRAARLTRDLWAAAPNRVIGPAPSPADPDRLAYAARMYASIPRRVPLAVHFYPRAQGTGYGIGSDWPRIERIAAGRPIWVTEVGFAESQYGARGQARRTAAAYRSLARHGAHAIIVYRLQDAEDRGNAWLGSLGMLSASGARKPVFHALRRAVREVARGRS